MLGLVDGKSHISGQSSHIHQGSDQTCCQKTCTACARHAAQVVRQRAGLLLKTNLSKAAPGAHEPQGRLSFCNDSYTSCVFSSGCSQRLLSTCRLANGPSAEEIFLWGLPFEGACAFRCERQQQGHDNMLKSLSRTLLSCSFRSAGH